MTLLAKREIIVSVPWTIQLSLTQTTIHSQKQFTLRSGLQIKCQNGDIIISFGCLVSLLNKLCSFYSFPNRIFSPLPPHVSLCGKNRKKRKHEYIGLISIIGIFFAWAKIRQLPLFNVIISTPVVRQTSWNSVIRWKK